MKLSVVATFYNCEEYVDICIKSILEQEYDDFEVIVIDDGSFDRTRERLQPYIQQGLVKPVFHQHQGVSAARNAGIETAQGEYIMFVDGDDYLSPSILKELAQSADAHPDIIACTCTAFDGQEYSYACHFFDGDRTANTLAEKEDFFGQLILVPYGQEKYTAHTAIGVPWGKLYKRSFLLEKGLRFKPELIRMQDNIFNTYAFYEANQIIYLDRPLYMYRLAHIQSYQLKPELNYRVLESRADFFKKHPEVYTDKLKAMFMRECMNFLLKAVKGFAVNDSYEAFCDHFDLWTGKLLCQEAMEHPPVLPGKKKILLFLVRHKWKKLIYQLFKAKKQS